MQIQVKPSFIQSFGGINFLEQYLRGIKFGDAVAAELGSRSVLAQYSYADLIKQLFFINCIGGDTLDESHTLQQQMQDHPHLRIASPDTIEYAFQELRQSNETAATASGRQHIINEHEGFNKLLVSLCCKTKLLNTAESYTLDYDGHVVKNTKGDNAFTYKKSEGYYPVICSINKLPVYMQNRNGNTPESYRQSAVIQAAIEQCGKHSITINRFRADASCYEKKLVDYLEQQSVIYYIRAEMNTGLLAALQDETDWHDAMLNYQKVQVCSIEYPVFGRQIKRIVAYRKKATGQLQIHHTDGYHYHAILTSDHTSTPLDVINFYNQRGCEGEHHFKELDYDFNWNKLPFDNMEMNTIFMYAALTGYVLFNACKKAFAEKIDFVSPAMRLKNFILHFVTLPAKWISTGRRWVLKLFTHKNYSPLCCT